MFTGIIEEIGVITRLQKSRASAILTVKGQVITDDLKLGDSVAVNGVCLTVRELHHDGFSADVMHETLDRSNLGGLTAGSRVNLERALAANGRFGGHIVSGHIDGTGTIRSKRNDDNAVWITVAAGPPLLKYIVPKGSITIDGISLTVASLTATDFSVSLIPHTGQATTLLDKQPGAQVNLENDIVGKYIERLLRFDGAAENQAASGNAGDGSLQGERGSITYEFLMKSGF